MTSNARGARHGTGSKPQPVASASILPRNRACGTLPRAPSPITERSGDPRLRTAVRRPGTKPFPSSPSATTFQVRGDFGLNTIRSNAYSRQKAAGCGGGRRDGAYHVGQTEPATESRRPTRWKCPPGSVGKKGHPIGGGGGDTVIPLPGPYQLTFSLDASFQADHGNQPIGIAVVLSSGGVVVAGDVGIVSATQDPSFSFAAGPVMERGTAYEVHYWIDSNIGGEHWGSAIPKRLITSGAWNSCPRPMT